jgi:hypothetical protein
MSGSNLEYTVLKKDSYYTNGKIDSICQKNSDGFDVEVEVGFTFEIKLKAKAVVNLI